MISPVLKNSVTGALIVLALLSIWFGSVLPWRKARSYIQAIQSLSTVKSVGEFEDAFNKSLLLASPVGQEEIVKFMGSDVIGNLVAQDNPEGISRTLVSFIEPHLFADDVMHLLAGANLYSMLWQKYQREEDFTKAEHYYRAALALGPKLPPVLYGLLNLYTLDNNKEKAAQIAQTILKYWPDDSNIQGLITRLK